MRQVLSEEEALAAALSWREDCARYAAERAGAWMQQSSSPGPASSDMPALMEEDGAMQSSQIRQHHAVGPESGGSDSLAAASDHVEVCGVALPRRAGEPGGAGSGLVRTRTAQAALEAAALVLCQERPLLLEGPPGARTCCKPCTIRMLAQQCVLWSRHPSAVGGSAAYIHTRCTC
jgi:hypothetical protein